MIHTIRSFAGQAPNVLAEEYIQMNLDSRVQSTEQAKEWLGKQLEELKAKVERRMKSCKPSGQKMTSSPRRQ